MILSSSTMRVVNFTPESVCAVVDAQIFRKMADDKQI